MRLHRLRITAFGPFARTERVDFDELSASGLFLLRGATGAGKSSVLDAVCFALYGEVPGARRGNPLRSDHAEAGLLTEVELELTLGGQRLKVLRRPEQLRPKKRGTGMTVEKPETLLSEWVPDAGEGAPGWRAVSKSHQEAGEQIHRLVGMSRDQFCQVVLLPQGEFARFLRADANDRAKLLRQLFDTGRFEQVERWLGEQKSRQEAVVRSDRQQVHELATRAEQAAGPQAQPLAAWVPESAGPEAFLGWAALLRTDAAEWAGIAARALAEAERVHRQEQERLRAEQELAERQRRHGEAVQAAAELAGTAESHRQDLARLGVAQQAATVEPVLRHHATAVAALAAAESAERRARSALAQAEPSPPVGSGAPAGNAARTHQDVDAVVGDQARDREQAVVGDQARDREQDRDGERAGGGGLAGQLLAAAQDTPVRPEGVRAGGRPAPGAADGSTRAEPAAPHGPGLPSPAGAEGRLRLAEADAEQLAGAERGLRADLGRLDAARADERRLPEAVREAEQAGHGLSRAEEAADRAADWLVDFDTRLKELQERQADAQAARARIEQLEARGTELRARLAAAAERDRLRGRIATAEGELILLRERAGDAREHSLDLRERRLAGMAAELAAQLTDGGPCRVCGATAHPSPARPSGAPVGRADEERAQAAQQQAEQQRDAAAQQLATLRVAEATAAATAGDDAAEQLAAALTAAGAEHRAALNEADALGQLQRQADRLTQQQQDRQAEQEQARLRAATLTSRLQILAEERSRLTERIAEARGGAPTVAARAAALAALADAVAAALAATRARAEAAERLADAAAELAEVSRSAGFGSPAEARAALLPAAEREALRARTDRVRADRELVEHQLARPELVAAAARPAADPVAAGQREQQALTRLRAASATDSTARERLSALTRIGRRLEQLTEAMGPALGRYEQIKRLTELASGTSTENVLRMRLESYVLAARLEQVAAAASDRLVRMSGGRYTLVHSDGRASGNRRSGLSLRVVDAWTGQDRDTSTLSGGESFFASLALALGLADVVTDESGGMPLDTLFIDEGFGSLDEQALEEVLDVLDGLRERDRAVGIVSHVADLRSRVPAQLLVQKGRHGSTLRLATRERS
ncbi:AAA family ATPase [Kitasatospora sp. NPDC096147]|uniref:AAA family ATPase n=1 Tax=Kitasatospora sp. NPDC096147 TaxID=3364093 RepID=UPI0037F99B33